MAIATRLTADEFLARGETELREELVDGEVVVNQPTWRHQDLAGELYFVLRAYTRAAPGRGAASLPIDVRLDDRNVYGPDVVWFTEATRPRADFVAHDGPPSLAIEVRSPSTWRYDVGTKRRVYEDRGLPELWLVDGTAETVLVFRRSAPSAPRFDVALELGRGETLRSPTLPGFGLALDALFAER